MKVYISGKMTGLTDDEIYNTFNAVAKRCEAPGREIINPAHYMKFYRELGYNYNQIMKHDIEMLMACDVIVMLPNWKESKGAQVEHYVADACGLQILYINEM